MQPVAGPRTFAWGAKAVTEDVFRNGEAIDRCAGDLKLGGIVDNLVEGFFGLLTEKQIRRVFIAARAGTGDPALS